MTSKDEVLSMFALDMHFTIQFLRINGFQNQFVQFYVPNNYDVQQPIRNYE